MGLRDLLALGLDYRVASSCSCYRAYSLKGCALRCRNKREEVRGPYLLGIISFMKYNPWRTSQSYSFYLVSVLYIASLVVVFLFDLLTSTPILWAYVVVSTLGELYFLVMFFADCLTHWKGRGLIITDQELTFYDEIKKEKVKVSIDSLLEFKYENRGKIYFAYKKHGRNEHSCVAQVFTKKERAFLDSIIATIYARDAKVNLHN